MPVSEAQRRQTHAELADLLHWEEIARSPQLARFLEYVVEAKLRGEEQNIKAYAIAVDVFGRPPSFDPQVDPIVRVQARRLRGLLDRYYDSGQSRTSVRIRLPVGRYVPEFVDQSGAGAFIPPLPSLAPMAETPSPSEAEPIAEVAAPAGPLPDRASRTNLGIRIGVVVALAGALAAVMGLELGWFGPGPRGYALPSGPQVAIGAFGNMTGDPTFDAIAAGLGAALATELARFDDISVKMADMKSKPPPGDGSALLLTGFIRRNAVNNIEFDAIVLHGTGADPTWATAIDEPQSDGLRSPAVEDAARVIAERVATYNGPFHAAGRAWLDSQRGLERNPTLYTCLLRFHRAAWTGREGDAAEARTCFDRLQQGEVQLTPALSAQAWLEANLVLRAARAGDNLSALLKPVIEMARRGAALAPNSSFAHEQLARVLDAALQRSEAKQEFTVALGLNPANLDARAAFAQTLALEGDWTAGAGEAAAAIKAVPAPPPWYYATPMLDAYRQGKYDEAIEAAMIYAAASGEMPVALAVAAAGEAKRQDIIGKYLTPLLSNAIFRSAGILPRLGLRITDPALLHHIGEGLILAGVPQDALTRAF